MSSETRKWRQLLEEQFGVQSEFAGHLEPIFERIAELEPSSQEREELLHGVAAAYRSTRVLRRRPVAGPDVGVLVDEFHHEIRKMDESLKLMRVCLERLQQRMRLPTPDRPERLLH